MIAKPVLFFDSGVGGLTVLQEARLKIGNHPFIYLADNEAFPYGAWHAEALREHILSLFTDFFKKYDPILTIIACNTASTLALVDLRKNFPNHLFVGTVPAIKPAAQQTSSGLITVLATEGTVRQTYTAELINSHAKNCQVNLVASKNLAYLAEQYLCGHNIDLVDITNEIRPCFIEQEGLRTDIVVLACTHYPFLINSFRKVAPWPVDWINPAEAIALQAASLLKGNKIMTSQVKDQDIILFTCNKVSPLKKRLVEGFGLSVVQYT